MGGGRCSLIVARTQTRTSRRMEQSRAGEEEVWRRLYSGSSSTLDTWEQDSRYQSGTERSSSLKLCTMNRSSYFSMPPNHVVNLHRKSSSPLQVSPSSAFSPALVRSSLFLFSRDNRKYNELVTQTFAMRYASAVACPLTNLGASSDLYN